MKKEKVLTIELPDGAKYRRVEVTEAGKVEIIYAEEVVDDTNVSIIVSKANRKKPFRRLIGATDVYQKKYNGTDYWYCKIKGRDEFMYLYLGDLTSNDLFYDADGNERKFVTEKQKKFRVDVMKALKYMPEESFRWIPVYEPSIDFRGNLQYVSRATVLRNLTSCEWEKKFQKYSPENGSQMASKTTYFLLLLRLLKDGLATMEQLADDSKEIGHYWDSENAKHEMEKTDERQFGGLYGFAGNTHKIVRDFESSSGFSNLGGSYLVFGNNGSLSSGEDDKYLDVAHYRGVGLMELAN